MPNDEQWISVITGALNSLIEPYNWEPFGLLTPKEAAQALVPMFDDFCHKKGFCRVIGEIIPFAGAVTPFPDKWLACDGSSLLRVDYADLFAVVGATYGAADSDHFSIPDLRGRSPLMAGDGPGLTERALGDSIGQETHQLTAAEMPSHSHSYTAAVATVINGGLEAPAASATPFPDVTSTAGADVAHNNMQPSLAINFFIVAKE